MKPTKKYTFTIPAGIGSAYRLLVAGEYWKILAASGAVTVRADWGTLTSMSVGNGLAATPFAFLVFENEVAGANTITVVVGDEAFIDGQLGVVSVSATAAPQANSITHANAAIGASASTLILAANTARGFLLVQNNDTADLWLAIGVPATGGSPSIKLGPGGVFAPTIVPTEAINAFSAAGTSSYSVVAG